MYNTKLQNHNSSTTCVSVHYQNHRMLHDRVGHRAVFPLEVFFKDFLFCKWPTIGSILKLFVLYRQISEVNFGQTIYPKTVLIFFIKTHRKDVLTL